MLQIGRIIVVGGGIGGLATAIALRQIGIETVVLERDLELRPIGAGLTLWTNALRALDVLGLRDAVEAAGARLDTGRTSSWRGQTLAETSIDEISRKHGAPSVCIHRGALQRVLLEAAGDVVRLAAPVVAVERGADRIVARLGDGSVMHADAVIGADGIHSVVRRALLGDQPLRYAGYVAWRGVCRLDATAVAPHVTELSVGRGSQVGLVPCGDDQLYWFATANLPIGLEEPAYARKSALLARFKDWQRPIPEVIAATDDSAILRHEIYDRPPVEHWGDGRATLLGDAAHPTTPNLGQGACMALEDAVVLARCLSDAHDLESGLRAYERQRIPRTSAIVRQSWQIGRMLQLRNPLACAARDLLLRAGQPLARKQMEMIVGYTP